jgi:hypothetical protein
MEERMTKLLSRRSVTTGLAAAAAAIPALGLAIATRGDPVERIKHHTRELEKAMRELYGTKEVAVLRFEPSEGGNPLVMVCPTMTEEQRARYAA